MCDLYTGYTILPDFRTKVGGATYTRVITVCICLRVGGCAKQFLKCNNNNFVISGVYGLLSGGIRADQLIR